MYNDFFDVKIGKIDIMFVMLGWILELFWERNVLIYLIVRNYLFLLMKNDIKMDELMIKFIFKINDIDVFKYIIVLKFINKCWNWINV